MTAYHECNLLVLFSFLDAGHSDHQGKNYQVQRHGSLLLTKYSRI